MSEHITANSTAEFLKILKDREVQFVDFNFTDFRGKWQHTAQHIDTVDKDLIEGGVMFDGSSIAGWKAINESDMILMPDVKKICMDPFAAQATVKIFCDVIEPSTGKPYTRCPRSIAKAAEAFMQSTGLADSSAFGPEAEFFIFDDVKFSADPHHCMFKLDSHEGPWNTATDFEHGNLGHRPRVKGGYFPEAPVDSSSNLRAEMVTVMKNMGVPVEKHHHEVAASQVELGIKYSSLVDSADNLQLYKHVVHNVADAYGKTATFMPKPVFGDNGSGMHVHQSLSKAGKPLFAGDKYAGLSEMALFYIGGIIKHAKALNAITNPTTNSYKRLVPGYEAPVLLAYSARNRSASCRIPHGTHPKAKRVEVRFPDPLANPYLAYAAMLMAGLDGIQNKLHPGDAMDKNLYELPEEELAKVPTVCGSLREAVESLSRDHEFLLKGNVFTHDMIEAYIDLKMDEIDAFETMPHPIEYMMYYSA
ncbi:MAG TPA: type I glutamate--ammonia ligase [Patescibacteria group bacterium]|nr:type I glutamate--ammonia ligase [Patescibacteria group bacterium]